MASHAALLFTQKKNSSNFLSLFCVRGRFIHIRKCPGRKNGVIYLISSLLSSPPHFTSLPYCFHFNKEKKIIYLFGILSVLCVCVFVSPDHAVTKQRNDISISQHEQWTHTHKNSERKKNIWLATWKLMLECPLAIPTCAVFFSSIYSNLNFALEFIPHVRRILFFFWLLLSVLTLVAKMRCQTNWPNCFYTNFRSLFVNQPNHFYSKQFSFLEQITAGWVCCIPCVWLRTSATVHKIALTTATLLVTSLLVASPVLFLLSTAPSQLPKDCNSKNDLNCLPTRSPAPECTTVACRTAAISIQSRTNWKIDPCKNFKNFSCSASRNSLKSIRSVQEGVDNLMQRMACQKKAYFTSLVLIEFPVFVHFYLSRRIIATQHNVGNFSEIGSPVRELFATTIECFIVASAYCTNWNVYADDSYGSGHH